MDGQVQIYGSLRTTQLGTKPKARKCGPPTRPEIVSLKSDSEHKPVSYGENESCLVLVLVCSYGFGWSLRKSRIMPSSKQDLVFHFEIPNSIQKMGLSSLPTPSEGMMCVLLVNAALFFSTIKGILRPILRIVGIHLSPPPSSSSSLDSMTSAPGPPYVDYDEGRRELASFASAAKIYLAEFRGNNPTIRFDTLSSSERPEYDCPVCRCEFEPESEVNLLSCNHLFHQECVEKWLRYLRGTCPVCRTPMLADGDFASYY
ncbi:hypothetical protein V6N13_128035 [Hibiscus sabdariffa]